MIRENGDVEKVRLFVNISCIALIKVELSDRADQKIGLQGHYSGSSPAASKRVIPCKAARRIWKPSPDGVNTSPVSLVSQEAPWTSPDGMNTSTV